MSLTFTYSVPAFQDLQVPDQPVTEAINFYSIVLRVMQQVPILRPALRNLLKPFTCMLFGVDSDVDYVGAGDSSHTAII